jgi:hypothetical protein
MELNGWAREAFKSDEQFAEWVQTRPTKEDYDARVAHVVGHGLPAKLKIAWDNSFLRIELEPLPGWTWLATDAAVASELANGRRPHISLSKWTADGATYDRIVERYHNRDIVVNVSSVGSGATAVLAWEGIGADPDLWDLYINGEFGYKWTENSFGLHVSL